MVFSLFNMLNQAMQIYIYFCDDPPGYQAGLITYSSPQYLRQFFFFVGVSFGWSLDLTKSRLTNCKSNRVPVLHK